MAAIKAHDAGADVLVVTKGAWGSGNTVKALAGFAAAFGHADPRDNPDVHFGDVVRNGVGLCNQKLVRKWVNTICGLTEEMRSWGLDLKRIGDKYSQIAWEGHTYPRMINHNRETGKYLIKCLRERASSLGIKVIEQMVIGGLLKADGEATGAWGFNYETGELFHFRCKTVIVCTGGFGAMYPVGDNVMQATGEGYAQAFDAGAKMIGMEFAHFLPTPIHPEGMHTRGVFTRITNGLLSAGARLYNGHGERFMFGYFPEQGEKGHSMEPLCRRIAQEITEGRAGLHGGIYFDLSDVPTRLREEEQYKRLFISADRSDIDLRRQPIELSTYPHDLVGGIRIDEFGRTNVPRLFAAGEAAGGSHGASRFGGSALSDCLVFGAASGEAAAALARDTNAVPPTNRAALDDVRGRLDAWSSGKGASPAEVRDRIRDLAFRHLNMVRSGPGLEAVLQEVKAFRRDVLPTMCTKVDGSLDFALLRQAIEAEGQVRLCELLATAALDRKESRGGYFGGHYRTEYEQQDDAGWLKNIVLCNDKGEIRIEYEAPVTLESLSKDAAATIATPWRARPGELVNQSE
ncbi:Succinate dehydrogenase flavoprotein subunit [Rhodovulum sp. PH10]|nr:Succinate dehydrogenase flavoprotein subunit [Rhodovulum sp. PH10]